MSVCRSETALDSPNTKASSIACSRVSASGDVEETRVRFIPLFRLSYRFSAAVSIAHAD